MNMTYQGSARQHACVSTCSRAKMRE